MLNIKNRCIVGVAVTPDNGLEVAQIDYETKTVLKYKSKQLAYDNNRKEIADMDIFKETLQDLLTELEIPKGTEVAICLPTITFKVTDYPASFSSDQISMAIEEELNAVPLFQDSEPCVSAVKMENSTMQFTKIASVALQKVTLIELVMQIKELGYKLVKIDTSVNCTLNSLIFNERINTTPDASWVLMLIENSTCRIIPMMGTNYVDAYEEKISIGEILGEEENYSTIIKTAEPILKNLPSQCLYIVSKTNIISAKVLANKIKYNAPIVHQESNIYNTEAFLPFAPEAPAENIKTISLDVIGAALDGYNKLNSIDFNLYNESLGDVYILEQPITITIGGHKIVTSLEYMVPRAIACAIVIFVALVLFLLPMHKANANKLEKIEQLDKEIEEINKFLEQNKNISSDLFDEGDEIRMGLAGNKNIYSYYTIVGTEIPKKLWLTGLELGQYTTIKGQADNLESVYSFFRNVKEYNPASGIKLQRLGLAANSKSKSISDFDTDSVITSMEADYYEFVISDAPEVKEEEGEQGKDENGNQKSSNKNTSKKSGLPAGLEPLE